MIHWRHVELLMKPVGGLKAGIKKLVRKKVTGKLTTQAMSHHKICDSVVHMHWCHC